MIIVRISGGIGNQLFQYAYGRAIAIKNHDVLKLETNSLHDGYRKFGLDAFMIKADIATKADFAAIGITDMSRTDFVARTERKTLEFFERNLPPEKKKVIREQDFIFNHNLMNISGDHYAIGLWQSEQYFKEYRTELLRELQLKNGLSAPAEKIKHDMENTESISIHIRRGDYVSNAATNKKHGVCPPQYYADAIQHIQKHVTAPAFFVFSDDIEWVKKNIPILGNVTYVSDRNSIRDEEELMLMSYCKHNIIANSSFSWWGAWLNQHNNKIVIAPKIWFLTNTDTKDLIPESWIRL